MTARNPPTRNAILTGLALTLLAVVYLVHFAALMNHAVDLPKNDEWVVYLGAKHYMEGAPDFKWLVRRHNEHRFVLTRIQTYALYHWNGLNMVTYQAMNFILYGVVLAAILWIARRLQPKVPLWSMAAFLVFLLSPLGYINHAWGIQSQFHYSMLFYSLAAVGLFSASQSRTALTLGVISGWLAIFSQAGGAVATLAVFGCFLLFKALRAYQAQGDERRRELTGGLSVFVALSVAYYLFSLGQFDRGSEQSQIVAPWTAKFWESIVNVTSYGFGYMLISTPWGTVCLALVLLPVVGLMWRNRHHPKASDWAACALVLGALAIIASIALGRGSLKGPRYFQYVGLLPPYVFLAWRAFLAAKRPQLWVAASLGLWAICAYGYKDHLSFDGYREVQQIQLAHEARVRDYYHGVGPVPTDLIPKPRPVSEYLRFAREINFNFVDRLSPREATPPPVPAKNVPPVGRVDAVLDRVAITGWALDPNTPEKNVEVRFYVGGPKGQGRLVGTTMADRPRPSITKSTGWRGDHGFRFLVAKLAQAGEPSDLHVYAVDSAGGSEHPLTATGIMDVADAGNQPPIGHLNGISSDGIISGWALDPDSPADTVEIHFYIDRGNPSPKGKFLGRTVADRSRIDVNDITGYPGDHGFRFQLPPEWQDGDPHVVDAFAIDLQRRRNPPLQGNGLRFLWDARGIEQLNHGSQ